MINLFDLQLSGDLINRLKSAILFEIGIYLFVSSLLNDDSHLNEHKLDIFYFIRIFPLPPSLQLTLLKLIARKRIKRENGRHWCENSIREAYYRR